MLRWWDAGNDKITLRDTLGWEHAQITSCFSINSSNNSSLSGGRCSFSVCFFLFWNVVFVRIGRKSKMFLPVLWTPTDTWKPMLVLANEWTNKQFLLVFVGGSNWVYSGINSPQEVGIFSHSQTFTLHLFLHTSCQVWKPFHYLFITKNQNT